MTNSEPVYDKREQFEKVQSGLIPGEHVVAVYDCTGGGTGFVGVTNRRLILQDNSWAGKKVAITSIPYGRITSVSVISDKSMMGKFFSSSSIAVTIGGTTHEAAFRGEEKAAHVHNVILHHIANG